MSAEIVLAETRFDRDSGADLVLWLLNALLAGVPGRHVQRLSMRFHDRCPAGETVTASLARSGEAQATARAFVGRHRLAQLKVTFGSVATAWDGLPEGAAAPPPCYPLAVQALGRGGAAMAAMAHRMAAAEGGLLAGFTLDLSPGGGSAPAPLRQGVAALDARFGLVSFPFSCGPTYGTIEAFRPKDPPAQATAAQVAASLTGLPGKGRSALVIGGSRGLGEVTAKICALGGADVTLTYRSSQAEAERIAAEITTAGGTCRILAFDVEADSVAQLTTLDTSPDALFYFATPRISVRHATLFDPDLFAGYARCYAERFLAVCRAVKSRTPGPLHVFYPSTTALDQVVPEFLEYAMAKAAGEELCRHLGHLVAGTTVTVKRLPRIATGQTVSFSPVTASDGLTVMRPIVEEIWAARQGERAQ